MADNLFDSAQLEALLNRLVTEIGEVKEGNRSIRDDLKRETESIRTEVSAGLKKLDGRVDLLADQSAQTARAVSAIEAFPVPYGRPKSYASATEFHSVSSPVRIRQGQGG